jgi:glutathione S-transferase
MMRLTGPRNSPDTRRVAVSMRYMGLEFLHEPLSVRDDKFTAINPVKRAPTLVLDDGMTLMESSLILAWLERLVAPERSLMPRDIKDFARAQRITALALTACDKAVQIALEEALRPVEKRYQPMIDLALEKVQTAFRLLEAEMGNGPEWFFGTKVMQADITTALAWGITQLALRDRVAPAAFPKVAGFATRAETLPEFVATPAS